MGSNTTQLASLLEPLECPACGAEVDANAARCPVCALNMDLARVHDARPRLIRWMLDGVSLPDWAQQRKWLWVWGLIYAALLGVLPMLDRFVFHIGPLFWMALIVVLTVALMSWLIAALEIAGDTRSSTLGGGVFVVSFFVLPLAAAAAMGYLARYLPKPAWRALNVANLVCYMALVGTLLADFIAWMAR